MSDEKDILMQKLGQLPLEEILKYESAAVFAGRFIDIVGISMILIFTMFPSFLLGLLGVPAIIILAEKGSNIDNALITIRRYVRTLQTEADK